MIVEIRFRRQTRSLKLLLYIIGCYILHISEVDYIKAKEGNTTGTFIYRILNTIVRVLATGVRV